MQGMVDQRMQCGVPALAKALEKCGLQGIELCLRRRLLAEAVAEGMGAAAPDGFERGFEVGELVRAGGEEGRAAAGAEDDADKVGEVGGVDDLVARVHAGEDGEGLRLGGGMKSGGAVGEAIGRERDDDLHVAGGQDHLAAVRGVWIAAVPERVNEGGQRGLWRSLRGKAWHRPLAVGHPIRVTDACAALAIVGQ